MAGKKAAVGESSKKASGNAKKAAAAAAKADAENQKKAVVEDQEWATGSKSNAKKEAAEAKKREAAAKKAANAAALAEEEASLPAKPASAKAKAPVKRARGIDDALAGVSTALNATGIDDALDALALTADAGKMAVDAHPERRVKAAFAAYYESRLPEAKEEHKGLRQNQLREVLWKEFEKSEENPFNKAGVVDYDASRDEIARAKKQEREKLEKRLAGE